jgi:hypothetical protein
MERCIQLKLLHTKNADKIRFEHIGFADVVLSDLHLGDGYQQAINEVLWIVSAFCSSNYSHEAIL